jgi:hypothetical protein
MHISLLSKSDSWNGVLEQIYVVPAIATTVTTTATAIIIQFSHVHHGTEICQSAAGNQTRTKKEKTTH